MSETLNAYMSDAEGYVPERTHLEQLKGNLKYIGIIGAVVLIVGIIIMKNKKR